MFSRLQWLLLNLSRQMWLRAAAFSALGLASALIAVLLKQYIPADLPTKIGANAVSSLLNVIASSMLAVTIFSLSTMVTAFSAATGNVTPRATRLLAADSTTQNALATFIGSFLFSLVGIICLNTGVYGNRGRVVLYAVTLLVVVMIVVTLLRWVDYVLTLGRVGPTNQRVEAAATKAMRARYKLPYLGGKPFVGTDADLPNGLSAIHAMEFGYVTHIDMSHLQEIAVDADVEIIVAALPGDLTGSSCPLAYVRSGDTGVITEKVRRAFGVEDKRSFDQDPRFGLCVLAEIASRAMSAAINDPGTAIEILGRGARVLAQWAPPYSGGLEIDDAVHFPRVHVPPVDMDSMFDDLFVPIARDGAANIEVTIQLQKMLQMLASLGEARYRKAALRQSEHALARSEAALTQPRDLERARKAAARVVDLAAA
jgi:uncharacterized membrane protein